MANENRRKTKRLPLRIPVQYQHILADGNPDIPIIANGNDIGQSGISFYSQEKIAINSKLKITFFVSGEDSVTFIGRAARVMLSEKPGMGYLVGAVMEGADTQAATAIKTFISRIDVENVIKRIDLENVMDIHFVAGYPPVIKKVGKLVMNEGEAFSEYILKNLLLGMLDDERYENFAATKELNFIFNSETGARFRVNFHIQQGKIEGVFRLIPSQVGLPFKLGLPSATETLLASKRGLVVIAGRTGSGKTTTLASMVEFLNSKRDGIIICVEDPIEYVHVNQRAIIKQREVGRDTLSFSLAAKNALRQNPDVLVIGEILDMETMETAITAAETGALVLTSIHAGNASQALDRIVSFFPADVQPYILKRMSLVLKAVITQELIPRLDEKGMALATEVLIVNSGVRHVVREGDWKQIPSLIQMGKNVQMQTMKDALWRLYRNGVIDEEYIKGDVT